MTDAVKPLTCIFCDAQGELLPDWGEHDRKVKHPQDHRVPWERCPLTGMIVELHWWNRRTPSAGWKLVPIEPTEAMLAACRHPRAYDDSRPEMVRLREITDQMRADDYKAMLSAAPENDL